MKPIALVHLSQLRPQAMTSEQLATQASSIDAPLMEGDSNDPQRGGGAQVAPLPIAAAASPVHAGKILGDALTTVIPSPHEEEQSYIPVALARSHLERVVADMHAMKEEQAARVAMLVDKYKAMEAETTRHYEHKLKELKAKAKAKFEREELKYHTLQEQSKAETLDSLKRIEAMQAASDEREREHGYKREEWREEMERTLLQHEEAVAKLMERMQRRLAEAVELQAKTLGTVHRQEIKELRVQCTEAQAEATRIGEELRRMHQRLAEREASHAAELERVRAEHYHDTEVAACLSTVINRVVDMADQTRRRRRSRELKTEIDRLGSLVASARANERVLEEELWTLEEKHRRMVEGTIAQTMDVVATAVAAMSAVPTVKREEEEDIREEKEQEEEEVRSRVVVVDGVTQTVGVQTRDASVATTPTKPMSSMEMVPAIQPVVAVAEACSQALDEPQPGLPDAQQPPELKETRSAAQLQVAADAERFKERNAALLRSKAALKDAKASLQTAMGRKDAAKASIKQWLSEFQRVNGREPSIDEKAQVKDLYLAFKETEDAVATVKDRVSVAKTQHQQLVREVELLSQWQALAVTAARGASRGASQEGERSQPARRMSVTEDKSTAESLAAVAALEKEILGLREKLETAKAERAQAEEGAQAARLEAKEASAQSKAYLARLADAEVQAKKSDNRPTSITSESKAVDPESKAQVDSYVIEAKALRHETETLRVSIAGLKEEVTLRAAEKHELETKVEQLKLHVELLDEAQDQSMLNDTKGDVGGGGDEKDDADSDGDKEDDETKVSALDMKADAKGGGVDSSADAQLIAHIRDAIEAGKAQWNKGDKVKCFQVYVKACERYIETLRVSHREEAGSVKSALQEAARLAPAKGSMVLRRALDACLAACEGRIAIASPARSTTASSPQKKTRKSVAVDGNVETVSPKKSFAPASEDVGGGGSGKALEEAKQKLKAMEAKAKADRVKITQLEVALAKAEAQLTNAMASGAGGGAGGGAATLLLERKLADAEKRHTKALEDAERSMKKEAAALTQQLTASQVRTQSLQEQVDALTKELVVAGGRANQLGKLETEVVELRGKAAQADALAQELGVSRTELAKLEASYKEEQALRKKYYNQIEDMKGKIRVYARCRPMSSSEVERGCAAAVRFVDEFSLELQTSHGPKTFAYDQMFTPASTQDQVFEDTKNLVQSAVDGYNVCIFAYGQTGSGKTFTMTGLEAMPGLTPRTIHHLFALAASSSATNTISFQATMLELYNDTLVDLLLLVDGGGGGETPKLDIKKNARGMVTVANATIKKCTSAQQTLKLFEMANKKRQVGATKMNAESSRSHSVFSILVENYNKTTKVTSIGKLSLVDLAGSERAGKTGATAERLKEAQAINKSLSALGDVIAALSSGEKFIPYRNNKLTQLMQDSLGGNAKTLMFVNISPADYNQEETQTSLQYASRVKLITNNANKTSESETVNRLKATIKQLRAGKADVDLEGLALD